jgi:hypothetical protein
MRVLAGNAVAHGPRPVPPSARFKTVVGQKYTIALQYTNGKRVRSRITNEEEMLYSLTTGEKAYFPIFVGEAIDSLTLAPGQPFTICHLGGGSWDVERAHYPQQPPQAPPQPPPQPYYPPPAAAAPPASSPMNGAGEDLPAIMARCQVRAIELTLAQVEAARTKGLTFLPTHEGLQACAATLFIAETRRQQ